jgi:hypothetical protein
MDNKLEELLGDYFSAGHAEGKEGRNHDTIEGTAQKAHHAILQRVKELIAAEREACANVAGMSQSEILLMSGEMSAQEMRSVKAVLGGVKARILNRSDR